MQFSKGLVTLLLGTCTLVGAHQPESSEKKIASNAEFSLQNLINVNKIPSGWALGESAVLEEGRIRLTPKTKSKGSLWEKNPYPLDKSFTLEWTFRSVDYAGDTDGGLSFWFISASKSKPLAGKSFFNGPSEFDGLHVLIDKNGPVSSTLGARLNDGTQSFTKENVHESTFASCLMGYQDSSVPSTVRLTYDRGNSLLKLQVDNRVCFQTRKVQIPQGDYFIGATADNSNTPESFEILKMKLYDSVIEESLIPNVNAMPQPKVMTKVVNKETGQESLLEKDVFDAQHDEVSNFELYKKLDKVEGKILANDINSLEDRLDDLARTQAELLKYVAHLSQNLQNAGSSSGSSKGDDDGNYKDFFSVNEKLEQMLDEQRKIREASRSSGSAGSHIDEIAGKLAIWILPLIVIMLVMAYYTFRIRQEIVKTKLL